MVAATKFPLAIVATPLLPAALGAGRPTALDCGLLCAASKRPALPPLGLGPWGPLAHWTHGPLGTRALGDLLNISAYLTKLRLYLTVLIWVRPLHLILVLTRQVTELLS